VRRSTDAVVTADLVERTLLEAADVVLGLASGDGLRVEDPWNATISTAFGSGRNCRTPVVNLDPTWTGLGREAAGAREARVAWPREGESGWPETACYTLGRPFWERRRGAGLADYWPTRNRGTKGY
jgi:hypothetical protein